METKKKENSLNHSTKYKLHHHVLMTHFPLSMFFTAFVFQMLHLFAFSDCFELASAVTLIGATITMPLTMITGWITWKKQYKRSTVNLFTRKIFVSFIMLAVSIALSVWWLLKFEAFLVEHMGLMHWSFLLGIIGLIAGSLVEGYYGGRLSHR